jgi:hypothetical protein
MAEFVAGTITDPAAQEEYARQLAARRAVALPTVQPSTGMPPVSVTAQPAPATPAAPQAATQTMPAVGGAKPTPPPVLSPEDRQVATTQSKLEADEGKKAGVERVMDAAKNIGSDPDSFMGRHPGIAKIARIGSEIGAGALRGVETAGDILAPRIAARIPGTELNRQVRLGQDEANVDEAEKNRTESAQAENLQAESAKNKALADKTSAGDIDKYELKEVKDTRKDSPTFGQNVWAGVNKTDPTDVRFTGQQTATPPGAEKIAPLTAETVRPYVDMLHTIPDQVIAQIPEVAKGETPQQKAARVEKSLLGMTPDEAKESLNQLRQTGTWQVTREATKAQQEATAAEHKREFNETASRKDIAAHDKAYIEPANKVEQSFGMMDKAYQEYEAARAQGKELPTGAQSMLALSTHLSTTFGNVKGARVTKDMIQEHLGARGISDKALVAVQRITNGDALSPDQWDAFHDLVGQSRMLTWNTAVREADRKHVPMDFLPDGLSAVKVEGHPAAVIPTSSLDAFKKKYPDAEQLSER